MPQPRSIKQVGKVTPRYKTSIKEDEIKSLIETYVTEQNLFNEGLDSREVSTVMRLHFPRSMDEIYRGGSFKPGIIEVLKFVEAYNHLRKLRNKRVEYPAMEALDGDISEFVSSLPFRLTDDQSRVIEEIRSDLNRQDKAAKRMIVGDVGSGKTMVILASAMMALPRCSILMAPTSLLALQLYEEAQKYLPSSVNIALVIQGKSEGDYRKADFIIGTHALLYLDDLPAAPLVMVDEQHRFGTKQRQRLEMMVRSGSKEEVGRRSEQLVVSSEQLSVSNGQLAEDGVGRGVPTPTNEQVQEARSSSRPIAQNELGVPANRVQSSGFRVQDVGWGAPAPTNEQISDQGSGFGVQEPTLNPQPSTLNSEDSRPHFLQFSATPIPRTQAMMESELLDVSLIESLPFEKRTKTDVIGRSDFADLLEHIKSEISRGDQVLIIYPLVEESEEVPYQSLDEARGFWEERFENVYVTHGKDKDKESILMEFREQGDILLATTVVEVGISLPRLTTIVIVGAERLGLATLHQLRGRVGRHGQESWCFLFTNRVQGSGFGIQEPRSSSRQDKDDTGASAPNKFGVPANRVQSSEFRIQDVGRGAPAPTNEQVQEARSSSRQTAPNKFGVPDASKGVRPANDSLLRNKSSEVRPLQRLWQFAQTTNGFEIARLDLMYRDSGDILDGTIQSGQRFKWLDMAEDEEIIKRAKSRAGSGDS